MIPKEIHPAADRNQHRLLLIQRQFPLLHAYSYKSQKFRSRFLILCNCQHIIRIPYKPRCLLRHLIVKILQIDVRENRRDAGALPDSPVLFHDLTILLKRFRLRIFQNQINDIRFF